MDLQEVIEYALSKKTVTESLPFDEDSPVYKVMGKIFMIASITPPYSINLKCDPEYAVELRDRFDAIQPGYHMNKNHWNTVMLDGTITSKLVKSLIDHSYEQVVSKLSKKEKEKLNAL